MVRRQECLLSRRLLTRTRVIYLSATASGVRREKGERLARIRVKNHDVTCNSLDRVGVTTGAQMLFTHSKDGKTFPIFTTEMRVFRTCFRDFSDDTLGQLKSLLDKTLTTALQGANHRKVASKWQNYGKLRPTKNELQAYLR